MEKSIKIVIGVAFFLIIILLFFMYISTILKNNGQENVIADTGFIEPLGNGDLEIIEFSDFACPVCKMQEPILKQILEKYGDKIKLYYRQFPLPMHKNSFDAALGSMCANEQEKFWQYHDVLFKNQIALDKTSLRRYAEQIGLNVEQFNSCLDEEKYKRDVKKDFNEGKKAGVRGTPTFFINDKKIEGFKDFEFFKNLIEQESK